MIERVGLRLRVVVIHHACFDTLRSIPWHASPQVPRGTRARIHASSPQVFTMMLARQPRALLAAIALVSVAVCAVVPAAPAASATASKATASKKKPAAKKQTGYHPHNGPA